MRISTWIIWVILLVPHFPQAQDSARIADYLRLNARPGDPLYTTYSASMERSRLYGDKAYKMDYYSSDKPLGYSSDHAGTIFSVWKIDQVVVPCMAEFHSPPIVQYSFPDMAITVYEPFRGIRVVETFLVYSSRLAIVNMEVTNLDTTAHDIQVYPVLDLGGDSMLVTGYDSAGGYYQTRRYEDPYRLISSLKTEYPYPLHVTDFFGGDGVKSHGIYMGEATGLYNVIKTDYYSDNRKDSLNFRTSGPAGYIVLQLQHRTGPGEKFTFRYLRGVKGQDENPALLAGEFAEMKTEALTSCFMDDLRLYKDVPLIPFKLNEQKLVYLGALNLARGCMLPATGKTKNNFYVFSRNPIWGWGHGHQVLHESLSMIPYAYMDPISAEGSQRVYMEQQRDDGLIAYRHGPRGLQDYPHKNMSTTSAPFFSYINLNIFNVSHDTAFLEEAFASGSRYLEWLIRNRDTDHDGTFEWGPYGIIENVRDWYNAVFQVSRERHLDIDKEDISDELECLDLTLMMIMEARCLSDMAAALGKTKESKKWNEFADHTSTLVNERMWDESSGFYYSVNKKDHTFFFMTRDLKRQEIIGFLALWARVAPPDRAARLVKTLTDPEKFWRRYGIPTLSAQDEWYSPYVDYCCKWNGPVWVPWNYLVYDGLKGYGYTREATELSRRLFDAVTVQLSRNHNFWESYSPDNEVLNCPSNYIWDAIMAKILIEEANY